MERLSLGRLFSACDVNKSGKIEYDDFTAVCRELNVSETEVRTLFDKFDPDEDGGIDYGRFASRFQEVSETLDFASLGARGGPWEEFESRIDAEAFLPESLREQLAHLYQAIHSSANTNLLQHYEEIIHSLISQSQDNRLECEQLETSIKRAEEMNNSQLSELEDDIKQQLAKTEERVRDEVSLTPAYFMPESSHRVKSIVFRVVPVIHVISSQQNEDLRTSLLQAQTDSAVLHSELDKLKNMYADQKAQHKRESDELKRMVMEYQSYSNQIQILQETNKKLYDSNDGLRSALASEAVAAKRRRSPQDEIPARRMKPLRQSTLNHGSPEQDPGKASYSHVATWADKYLDSGVSLPMDTAESSGSDYDSGADDDDDDDDDEGASVETVHHSYSYVPSDVEVSEVKSESAAKMARSKASSIASSLRRRLSAFSTKPLEADLEETTEPAPMFRLVLAGDAGAGKSSFLLRLTLNDFRGDIPTTLGVDFQIKRMLVDGEKTSLQIWDTAGQERFRSIARSYFRKAHGVLLLYDVTSESSFLNVRAWVDQIQDSTEDKIPMCVIGNKVDLREQLPEGSCVSSLHGEKLAKAYGALFCETSAKEGTNVVETVLHLAREVKKSVKLRRQSFSQVRLSPSNPKKTLNACCGL
uniref:RAS and EF-hand domain containing 2 n=1 Tax=Gasterosteus aculeatus aculeatus TaxID=481459 RepID=A0AAQ4NVJ5_GASAC